MKRFLYLLALCSVQLHGQDNFESYFINESLRIDFILAGNSRECRVYLNLLKREPFWGGSRRNLVDTSGYGRFRVNVTHVATGKMIFSSGFCTLFQEWQTTQEAKKNEKGFFQSVVIPYPRDSVRIQLSETDNYGKQQELFSMVLDPSDYFIRPSPEEKYEVVNYLISGEPSRCVDIVFLPEGYTEIEMNKFIGDVKRLTDTLFTYSPFNKYREKFNIYAVLAPSVEPGTDIPGEGVWRNTILNTSFYTFDIERYLTAYDYWKVRDLASNVPYDQVYILVNSDRYGGGGIYNHYSLTTVDNPYTPFIFIHEFGHGFGALADEYYSSEVPYESFYPLDAEPWEPNITTMVGFDRKWKTLLTPGVPVPTPDSLKYRDVTGVFEGAGYQAKGIYRPQYDCIMKSNRKNSFCSVCERSIEKMIHWLTD